MSDEIEPTYYDFHISVQADSVEEAEALLWSAFDLDEGPVSIVAHLQPGLWEITIAERHTLAGTSCSCGGWQAQLGESITRGFDRHLLEVHQ